MSSTELKTPLLKEEDLDQDQIAVRILEEDKLSPDVTDFKTMKQAVDEAWFDKIYCFETRHGELWSTALEGLFVPLLGQFLAMWSMYRLLKRRNIVYLYKFRNGDGEFFITFKKREDNTLSKKPTPKIEDFDITLSQIHSSKNGDEYVAVPLKYDHASGVITYPYFVNVASSRGDGRATTTTEVYSTIRPHERSNMIITEDMTQQLTDMEVSPVSPIMSAVEAIKKVNYSQCLDRQKKFRDYNHTIQTKQHRDLDYVAQEFDKAYYDLDKFVHGYSSKNGGSAKKKYTSRIISRKRRLSGKKGRKCRKSYKNVKSRKMARK